MNVLVDELLLLDQCEIRRGSVDARRLLMDGGVHRLARALAADQSLHAPLGVRTAARVVHGRRLLLRCPPSWMRRWSSLWRIWRSCSLPRRHEEKAEENGWDDNERESAAPHPGRRRLRPDCRLRGAPHPILFPNGYSIQYCVNCVLRQCRITPLHESHHIQVLYWMGLQIVLLIRFSVTMMRGLWEPETFSF